MDLILVAVAVAAGVGVDRLAILGLVLFFPWGFAAIVVVLAWLGSRGAGDRTARFLEGAAAELRSGSSLRQALAAAAAAVGESRLADDALTLSYEEVASEAALAFPRVGRELAVGVAGAARSGAPSADLFDELASLAMAHEEIRREVRVAAAPGRVAAGVLVGAPAFYIGLRWASGDLGSLFEASGQRLVATAGLALFLAGLAGGVLVLWRAR